MGYFNGHICRLRKGVFFFLILLLGNALFAQNSEQVAYKLRAPFYEKDKDLPTIILSAEEARPIGVRFELKNVILRWIGDKIHIIKGVIKTPSAIYDKSSLRVLGNDKIEYRSDAMDLDGVGFDIDQVKQTIHIRSKVKVVLRERLEHHRGEKRKLGKLSLKKSAKGLLLEPIKPEEDKNKNLKQEIKENKASNFDWTTWFWLIMLLFFTIVVIIVLMKKNKKRSLVKNSSKKYF
jgi:hypothetical protein